MWSWFRKERSPGASPGATNGSSFTVRVMWHPDHHLAVGLLSGYQLYAREEIEIDDSTESSPVANARGILSAVPAQVAIEMRKYGVELLLGLGGYITSAILRDSSVVYGRHFELGFLAQLGYDLPVTSRITLVPAVQMNHINFRSVTTFAPSLAIRYELYRY